MNPLDHNGLPKFFIILDFSFTVNDCDSKSGPISECDLFGVFWRINSSIRSKIGDHGMENTLRDRIRS